MTVPEPRRSQALLAAWAVGVLGISALVDLRHLGLAALGSAVLLARGSVRAARRALLAVLPPSGGLALASMAWLRLLEGRWPDAAPYAAMVIRAVLIAFVTFAVLARVDLLRASAPFPLASRLLVLTLGQIHALRLVAAESRLGLRSRLLHRPAALDVLRGAGGLTGALLTLSIRNARDIQDAMRSRGF